MEGGSIKLFRKGGSKSRGHRISVLGNGDNISYAQSYSYVSSYMAVLYVVHGPCGQHVLGNGDNISYAQSYRYVGSYMTVVYVDHDPCGQHVLGNVGNISIIYQAIQLLCI